MHEPPQDTTTLHRSLVIRYGHCDETLTSTPTHYRVNHRRPGELWCEAVQVVRGGQQEMHTTPRTSTRPHPTPPAAAPPPPPRPALLHLHSGLFAPPGPVPQYHGPPRPDLSTPQHAPPFELREEYGRRLTARGSNHEYATLENGEREPPQDDSSSKHEYAALLSEERASTG